ncbi:hypothetical protein H4582DRAFT_702259 [Lactarius indigo]|nr:hypothetical protein H4582DRAFT_702259 [Lactarius indigo]
MSNTGDLQVPLTAISALGLNHDVLLEVFHWYRLGNTTDVFNQDWNLERWWYKLIHVCQTWRDLILASPTSLDLHLVCTYGTPVMTMLTHSPPLPLIVYYPGGPGDAEVKVDDVLFVLQLRERIHRIHIGAPAVRLLGLLDSMDDEYPELQHLIICCDTDQPCAASLRTGVGLPAKLRAPHLRRLTLVGIRSPAGSELLLRAEGLVTLELLDVMDSLKAHPVDLVARLARMAQLERLVVHFRTALPNRKVGRMLPRMGTTPSALPRLKHLSFHGDSAYLEGVVARISAPSLQTLFLNFFARLTFDLHHLVRIIRTAQRQPSSPSSTAYPEGSGARFQFDAAELHFDAETAYVLLDSRSTDPGQSRTNSVQLRVRCRALDWQLAGLAQVCGALAPLFERVEHLTLRLNISHPNPNTDADSDSRRQQWHVLLRTFSGAKTLQLADPHAEHLVRSLLPLPAPTLQKLLASSGEPLVVKGDLLFYDIFAIRRHFKNIGRAYREQATTLIEICRLYVEASPQTYSTDRDLQNILRLADSVLVAAGSAGKGTTVEATKAFVRFQEEINRFGPPPPQKVIPGSLRKKLLDPSTALEFASKKDEKSKSTLSKVKSVFKAPIPMGDTKIVNFIILESPHEERDDQLIMRQEIYNFTTAAEIIWRFSRYPENSTDRISPKVASRQNPHFYRQLSKDAASYDSKFHQYPLKDFSHGLDQGDTIYILLDKSCRLFLDAANPHIPRIFGNLWKPDQTVILKDIGGILSSEDIVLHSIGESQDYWYRPSIIDFSQGRAQWDYSGADSDIVNTPFASARAVIHAAVRAERVDLMIRDRSRPLPPPDSGWKLLPSPELNVRVQAPEDQTTPMQSATRLPQLEHLNPNASAPSIGDSTPLATSTQSSEAVVN